MEQQKVTPEVKEVVQEKPQAPQVNLSTLSKNELITVVEVKDNMIAELERQLKAKDAQIIKAQNQNDELAKINEAITKDKHGLIQQLNETNGELEQTKLLYAKRLRNLRLIKASIEDFLDSDPNKDKPLF